MILGAVLILRDSQRAQPTPAPTTPADLDSVRATAGSEQR
jgi:hypothetical protein